MPPGDPAHSPSPRPADLLVVDDEPRMRDLLTGLAPGMGMTARAARSAEEAIRRMEESPAAVVLMDLGLPGMNGLDALAVIRRRWPNTAAVILTAYASLDAARRAIHLDVVEFLTKPCPLGELEAAIDRARKRAARIDAAAEPDPRSPADESTPRPGPASEPASGQPIDAAPFPVAVHGSEPVSLDDLERQHILAALHRHRGNRQAAAAELGISVRTLYYRLAEYQRRGLMDGCEE